MTQVILPYSEGYSDHNEALDLCFEAFYGIPTFDIDLKFGEKIYSVVITTNGALGKNKVIQVAKGLGYEYVFFVKNDDLFKKYCDTGIVEKLGKIKKNPEDDQFNILWECVNG